MTGLVPLLTVEELAESFKISPDRVRRHCKTGVWPYTPFGRNIRFTHEQVTAILALHEREVAVPAPRTRRIHSTRRRANA